MKGKIILIAGFAVAALAYFVVEGYWSDGQEAPPFDAPEHEKTVILVYDMTPSYAELMTKDGAAYKFSLRVVDSYVRTNGSDKIILAQIAGKDSKAITWDGKPADLIRAFPDAEAF
jgi:hypothetical protein